MPKFYGKSEWDPKLILLQIICLQCIHYLVLGMILTLFNGSTVSLAHMFAYTKQEFSEVGGPKNSIAVILSSFANALLLSVIVERSKKCLDFTITLYFVDFVVSSLYGGFPLTLDWWIIHLISAVITVLLGEYFCSRRELSDIPMLDFISGSSTRQSLPK